MTETLTADELEFILWEADDPYSRPCEAERLDCPNVALYVMRWAPAETGNQFLPPCHCGKQRLCLTCKDYVLFGQGTWDDDLYRCRKCDGITILKGVDPLR